MSRVKLNYRTKYHVLVKAGAAVVRTIPIVIIAIFIITILTCNMGFVQSRNYTDDLRLIMMMMIMMIKITHAYNSEDNLSMMGTIVRYKCW